MTCPVIFRDSDDNLQIGTICYEGYENDEGQFVVLTCRVVEFLEEEVRSGDLHEDIKVSIAVAERVDLELTPYGVVIDCEIEFEIMEEVTEIKCKAA